MIDGYTRLCEFLERYVNFIRYQSGEHECRDAIAICTNCLATLLTASFFLGRIDAIGALQHASVLSGPAMQKLGTPPELAWMVILQGALNGTREVMPQSLDEFLSTLRLVLETKAANGDDVKDASIFAAALDQALEALTRSTSETTDETLQ